MNISLFSLNSQL